MRSPDSDIRLLSLRRRAPALVAFGLIYGLLLSLGYGLRDPHDAADILWPPAGLLLISLFTTSTRTWMWLLLLQVGLQLLVSCLYLRQFQPGGSLLHAASDFLGAAVAASVARRLIPRAGLPRIRQVVAFLGAAAIGAAVSATVCIWGATNHPGTVSDLRQWQLSWAGNWLGSLAIAPATLMWLIRWQLPELSVPKVRLWELAVTATVLLGMTAWIFSASPANMTSILQLPSTLLVLLVVAAFRLPPRWSTTLAATVVLLAAELSSRGLGPFESDSNPFARLSNLQLYLAALAVFTFMLSTVLLEKQRAFEQLALSEERYRHLITHSTAAVWRVELEPPMPLNLAAQERAAWLRETVRMGEHNPAYRQFDRSYDATDLSPWKANAAWFSMYLEHLDAAAGQGYSIDGLRLTNRVDNRHEVYLASFSGVIERDRLVRIWGMARNITELAQLNEQLRRDQERLQGYARQLVVSEERARRSIAVGLRERIERQLAELSTTLHDLCDHAPAGLRSVLLRLIPSFDSAQSYTRQLIEEVSPPRLYDVGLGAALQWLSVYMRGQSGLQIDLQMDINERGLGLDLRAAAFHIVRELISNVVRHARVSSARVTIDQDAKALRLEVVDQGTGFNLQHDLFADQPGGFGLLAIEDRVRSARGSLSVVTAPGKGCHVTVHLPIEHNDDRTASTDASGTSR